MNREELKIYEPDLGLNGTIPQLVDWANRYTSDYSDAALLRLSELAKQFGFGEKYIKIPVLLLNERDFENRNCQVNAAYERLRIDHLLGGKVSFSVSNYETPGTELEIYEDRGSVVLHLNGSDESGVWHAANIYTMDEFMQGDGRWLEKAIGETLFYGKQYDEEVNV